MIGKTRFVVVYVMLIVVGLYINIHTDREVPTNKPLAEFPVSVQSWRMTSQSEFSQGVLSVLRPTDYISRQYRGDSGRTVNLYIGYHGGGKDSGEIHSPKHCLPGSGWYKVASDDMEMGVNGEKLNLVKAVYQNGEQREMFLYWFQVRGKSISNEYALKLAEIVNSLLHSRRDSAFIRISVPMESGGELASVDGKRFVEDFYPVVRRFLP